MFDNLRIYIILVIIYILFVLILQRKYSVIKNLSDIII